MGKILKETRTLERENAGAEKLLTARQKSDIEIITRVYRQQKAHFENNNPRESVKDRIVRISKPYVRPIVRGKEVKSVEFGAKCNNIQVDGLSFIEKLSFNAFNEGTRLPHCLKMHRKLFGVDAKKVGGDAIYAGSANREYCKDRGIQTSFVKRGRPWPETHQGKDEVDRNPVHLLWHPHGECSTARPAGSQRNCPGCLMFEVSEKWPFHWSIGSR